MIVLMKYFLSGYMIRFLPFILFCLLLVPGRAHALSQEFGVIGAVPSLGSDSSKQAATDKIADLGMGWMRHEFHYQDSMGFEHYDAAHNKAKAKGIKTLGLLAYPGSDKTHDQWKSYVRSVVAHYGSEIPAWEIMNEADNYLSGADYVIYLKEAHEIIKSINPSATIVLTGITSRPETPNFWSAVAAAGGWNYFDVAGLHVYHDGNPEKVNFGGGDLLAEYDRAVAALKKNGGGKKIWVTETGYKAGDTGNDNQANWLARTLIMTRSVSAIEKIFIYRLWDGDGSSYGLTTSSLAERPAYGVVRSVVANLSGAGIGTRLYPQSKQTLDSFDSVSGWSTKATSNGTATLSATEGKSGGGMKIAYNFTADKAYAVAEKNLPINGTPQALAAWFYGDDTKNVWKYRFKDAKGETFQADLGNLVSGWNYKQFTIGQDTAYVSWDGDGKIDYPISFNSFVVDRQGGEAGAEGRVDELIAVTGGADLFAFQFGSKVAYWKVVDSATAELCGASRQFTVVPQYAANVTCSDTPATSTATTATATTAKKVTPSPKPSPTPSPIVPIDKTQSTIRIDGQSIVADGQASYRIVMLFRSADGVIIKDRKPVLSSAQAVQLSDPILVGDEWWATVTSTEVGDKTVLIKSGATDFDPLTLVFVAISSPEPTPSPLPLPTFAPASPQKGVSLVVVAGAIGGSLGFLGLIYGYLVWRGLASLPRFRRH